MRTWYVYLKLNSKIGDLPTRFSYTKVVPDSFSLTTEEILLADDADLNSFVGLKKLAPYRPEANDEEASKRIVKKRKLKELKDKLEGRKWVNEPAQNDSSASKKRLGKKERQKLKASLS